MKKKMKPFWGALFLFFPLSVFATDYCPQKFSVTDGDIAPPSGWHVTQKELSTPVSPKATHAPEVLFHIAVINYEREKPGNQNRVTCIYRSRDNLYEYEITTDTANHVKPDDSDWKAFEGNSFICIPNQQLNVNDCPWE